jgi:hypothetical protein
MACRFAALHLSGGSSELRRGAIEAAGFSEEHRSARRHRIDDRRHSKRPVRNAAGTPFSSSSKMV